MDSSVDEFGVPGNMFGPMPPDFYGVIGRVVMVSALIEYKLSVVVDTLDGMPVGTNAGQPARQLSRRLEELTGEHDGIPALAELAPRLQSLFNERNTIAHSLWPSPTMDRAYGWRGVIERLRESGEPIAEVIYDRESFTALIKQLVDVHSALHEVLSLGKLDRPRH